MSVTKVRSGVPVARYSMFEAPENAPFIEVQFCSPHRLISNSLAALDGSPESCIPVMPVDMETVWSPAVVYVWDTGPVASVELPSPQCTVYDPEPGIVMDSLGEVVFHTITKDVNRTGMSWVSVMLLPAKS